MERLCGQARIKGFVIGDWKEGKERAESAGMPWLPVGSPSECDVASLGFHVLGAFAPGRCAVGSWK